MQEQNFVNKLCAEQERAGIREKCCDKCEHCFFDSTDSPTGTFRFVAGCELGYEIENDWDYSCDRFQERDLK